MAAALAQRLSGVLAGAVCNGIGVNGVQIGFQFVIFQDLGGVVHSLTHGDDAHASAAVRHVGHGFLHLGAAEGVVPVGRLGRAVLGGVGLGNAGKQAGAVVADLCFGFVEVFAHDDAVAAGLQKLFFKGCRVQTCSGGNCLGRLRQKFAEESNFTVALGEHGFVSGYQRLNHRQLNRLLGREAVHDVGQFLVDVHITPPNMFFSSVIVYEERQNAVS